MAYLHALGSYLAVRVVDNVELASLVGADPDWILNVTGIEQRRFATTEESVASLGVLAAKDCLESVGVSASEMGSVFVASGPSGRRFPGPATAVGAALGICGTPSINLPLAGAGSLFGLALAARLCAGYRNVLSLRLPEKV